MRLQVNLQIAIYISMLMGFGLILLLCWGLNAAGSASAASPILVDDDTCPDVGDGSPGNPYCTIQDAVDAALSGDEIHVAMGTYTGAFTKTGSTGYEYVQVVYIDRALTLGGGYNPANWSADPDPVAHPTIIDAQRYGRGVTVVGTGSESVTIRGFTITGGDYTGKGNPPEVHHAECINTGWDCGGGLYAYQAEIYLKDLLIYDNFGSRPGTGRHADGGGIYLNQVLSNSRIESTRIISNSVHGANGTGGGLSSDFGGGLVFWNVDLQENFSANEGGGAYLFQPSGSVVIQRSNFANNQAGGAGGGLKVNLTAPGDALVLDRVLLTGNTADRGAGLFIAKRGSDGNSANLSNVIIANNRPPAPSTTSSVLHLTNTADFTTTIAHLTAAGNTSTHFLYANSDSDPNVLRVEAYNTLISDIENAYSAAQNASGVVEIDHTRTFFSNVTNEHYTASGTPSFSSSEALSGDPLLDPSFHLRYGSPAIDAGFSVDVQLDIDSEQRSDEYPDIGADEYYGHLFLPLLLR